MHSTRTRVIKADPGVGRAQRLGGAGEQAVHKPHTRFGPGQGGQQVAAAVDRQVMDHHQEHCPGGERGPVPDVAGPGTFGSGGGVHLAASAAHCVLDVLGDRRTHGGDLELLEVVHHTEIGRGGQVRAAPAGALREPVLVIVRGIRPRQVRPRAPFCLPLARLGVARP
jgi:hypothetical protein